MTSIVRLCLNVLHFFLKISPSQVKVVIIQEKSQKSWEFETLKMPLWTRWKQHFKDSLQYNYTSCRLLPHWTYLLWIHSNYNTHSLYHFENPAIVAIKSDIVTFIHVKSIKVTSGFNLRRMKKIRQRALTCKKIKNKS